jgi:hypothetical protein
MHYLVTSRHVVEELFRRLPQSRLPPTPRFPPTGSTLRGNSHGDLEPEPRLEQVRDPHLQ